MNWLKVLFGLLIAADFSLIASMAVNYQKNDSYLVGLALIGVIVVTAALIQVVLKARKKIDELEEL